jgi:hypothetical protein
LQHHKLNRNPGIPGRCFPRFHIAGTGLLLLRADLSVKPSNRLSGSSKAQNPKAKSQLLLTEMLLSLNGDGALPVHDILLCAEQAIGFGSLCSEIDRVVNFLRLRIFLLSFIIYLC